MRTNSKIAICVVMLLAVVVAACGGRSRMPKPKAYFRIDFPEKAYKLYDTTCPFAFELPDYAFIVDDKENDCWFDIYFPLNDATIFFTYKPICNNLAALFEDARTFVYKHTVKADAIEELRYENDSCGVYGIMYDLKGNTASSVQFVLTDSVRHFCRGALYFNVAPNKDSLAPAIDFIRSDIIHLMETFRWK